MFRPSLGHSQALKENRSKITYILLLNLGREPGYPERDFPQFSSFPWLHQRQVMLVYFQELPNSSFISRPIIRRCKICDTGSFVKNIQLFQSPCRQIPGLYIKLSNKYFFPNPVEFIW